MAQTYNGNLNAAGATFAIVAGRFNHFIVDALVSGAQDAIVRTGGSADDIDVFWAPGAFEIPQLTKMVLAKGKYDAIVSVGAVIRGSTPHFDYVAGEVAKGIGNLCMNSETPISFGVLTTDTIEQAIERSGTKAGNKGFEAALAAIEMLDLFKQIQK